MSNSAVSRENIDSQYTSYKNTIDANSQEATRILNSYNSTITSQSQQATSKLSSYNTSVDAFTRELNNKKTEFQNSSSLMNTALALYTRLQEAAVTISSLISQATTNITATKETNNKANAELSSIRSKNSQASNDAAAAKEQLEATNKVVQDALAAKGVADQHKADAQGYSLAASKHASTAADFERSTKEELAKAKEINARMNEQYEKAKMLLQNTANTLQTSGSSAVADIAINEGQAPFTNLREGLENNYSDNELLLFAGAKSAEDRQNMTRNRLLQISELLAQKDSVANNILMDYMYKNEKGTNVSTIMDRVGQLNNDKKRKLEITSYYNKSREKYINILKVIVLACIIIVPLVIANKNNMISNPIFMFITVTIIFLTIIYIFSSMVDIYKRDNIDFDKYNIPYDRRAAMLEKDGTIFRKKNPLSSLTLTCVGQDCCDISMQYDSAKSKCIATENFGNIFETMAAMNTTIATVYPNSTEGYVNNCNFKNSMIQNSLGCSSIDKFITNDCTSTLQMQF